MVQHLEFFLAGAFVASLFLQYLVIDLSHKKGIFIDDNLADLPQKFHNIPTPRIGGLGIFIGCFFMMSNTNIGLYIMLASVPAFVSGLLEDLYAKISPGRRLIIMLISALMAIYLLGIVVVDYGFVKLPVEIAVVVTIIAVLGMINGTNLIDGINGLSAGISLIIFGTYCFMAYRFGDMDLLFVNGICAVSLIGFLFFNYPYGKIFLGDGGAYFTGFVLAVVSILLVHRHPEISPWFVLVCLIHPVWEVMFSFFRKSVFDKVSPFKPDPYHIHQFIFIYVSNKNNPLTTLVILPFVIISCGLASLFYYDHLILALIALTYIILYTASYYILYFKHMRSIEQGVLHMTRESGLVDKSPNQAETEK